MSQMDNQPSVTVKCAMPESIIINRSMQVRRGGWE